MSVYANIPQDIGNIIYTSRGWLCILMNKTLFNMDCMVIMVHSNTLYTNNKNQQVLMCISYLRQQELNTIQQKITTYINVDTALILKFSLLIHNYICTNQ